MKAIIEKIENLLAELKGKVMDPADIKVQLSDLKAGDVFETSFGEMIVLDNFEEKTLVITKGFVSDGRKFDEESPNFAESDISEYLSGEVLKMFENEFGEENIDEHITDVFSVDMQKYDSYMGKIRLLTFDEARKYNELIVNEELPKWWWTMTPWSTEKRGWKNGVAVVSPSGDVIDCICYDNDGVRPVCILKSNIFVSEDD